MDRSFEDNTPIRYLGEEMAFFFHWLRFYIFQLLIPCIIAFVLFFRRFTLDPESQKMVQDSFALFMALWAAQFCENYSRNAIMQSALWGTRNYDSVASVRPGYKV